MAPARDRRRDGGRSRLARWAEHGLTILGGTGIAVLLSAAFAASASADDGDSLAGTVVPETVRTVQTIGTVDDVAAPMVREVVEPAAAALEPAVEDVVTPPVATVPVLEQTVAPVAEDVVQSVAEEVIDPVAEDVEAVVADVAKPVVGDLTPVTDAVPPDLKLATDAAESSVVPVASAVGEVPRPVAGTTGEVVVLVPDSVAAPLPPPARDARDPVERLAPEPDRVAASTSAHRDAGTPFHVAALTAPLVSSPDAVAPSPGTTTGGGSTTSSPAPMATVPAQPGSAGPSHGTAAADADPARSLVLPADDLRLVPAAAPPAALLDVLLEISAAPD